MTAAGSAWTPMQHVSRWVIMPMNAARPTWGPKPYARMIWAPAEVGGLEKTSHLAHADVDLHQLHQRAGHQPVGHVHQDVGAAPDRTSIAGS